jgi:LytR cell envelope-related transcriptional attenuator
LAVVRLNQVIGVLAAAGVVALVGLSLNQDSTPQTSAMVTNPTLPPAGDVPPTESAATTTTDVATEESGTEPAQDDSTTSATAEPAPTTSTTTLVPEGLRGFVALQVVNGGAAPGRASALTAQLTTAGFAPRRPQDAVENVDVTTIYYAPGEELIALSVNSEIGLPPERLVEVPPDEPNWAAYGTDLDVMVILGPS